MKSLPFFKGLSWLLLLNLLIKPVWIFFIDRQVQVHAGNAAYGRYFALLNLSYVLYFLADAGLSNMLNQRIAHRHGVNLRQLLGIKLMLLLVFGIATFFVAWLTHVQQYEMLFYVVLIQALTSLFIFLRSIITAHQYFTLDAFFSVIDKSLMILICGTLLYTSLFGGLDLLLFLQIQCCCTAAAVALAAWQINERSLISGGTRETSGRIVQLVLPFALIILLMSTHYRLDGFLLERLHPQGDLEAGLYASAYRLLDAGNMAGYLAASFLVPFIARHRTDKALTGQAVLQLRHGLLFIAIATVSFTLVFATWIQQALYHTADARHTLIIRTCIAALPAYYLVHIYGSVLTAMGRFRSFITLLTVSVIINLVLNLVLIPGYGALGCCLAALASQYFCGLSTYIVATRSEGLPFGARSNIAYLALAAGLTLFFWGSSKVISHVWIILALFAAAILIVLATQADRIKIYFRSFR